MQKRAHKTLNSTMNIIHEFDLTSMKRDKNDLVLVEYCANGIINELPFVLHQQLYQINNKYTAVQITQVNSIYDQKHLQIIYLPKISIFMFRQSLLQTCKWLNNCHYYCNMNIFRIYIYIYIYILMKFLVSSTKYLIVEYIVTCKCYLLIASVSFICNSE